jgi:hypothetical protein
MHRGSRIESSTDPNYRALYPEYREESHSTDDVGGTLFYTSTSVSGRPIRSGIVAPPRISAPPHPRRSTYHDPGESRRREEGVSDQGYANYPRPTGGTFVQPRHLPPVRTYHLE